MYYEEINQIEYKTSYDVVVVGGGMAGVAAAAASAREGLRTLLIEKSVALGGLATLGHVVCYEPLDDGFGNQIIGGISEEMMKRSIQYGYDNLPRIWKDKLNIVDDKADDPEMWEHFNPYETILRCQTFFNMPAFVFALDEMMEQAGVDVMFDTIFCKPIMDGKRVKGLIVESKSGRYAYGAGMVVDASGDADVLYRAGAKCSDFPNHLSYMAYDIDFERMKAGIEHNNMFRAFPDWLMLGYNPITHKGESHEYYGTNVESINEFIKDSRKLAFEYLKEHMGPDYTQISICGMPNFRRTRRIDAMYTLTEEDYHKRFDDSIGVTADWRGVGPVLEIPYRSLIDPDIENVISSGRIIGSTGDAWELTRCIPQAALTGEAAGRAAAQAFKHKQTLQEINISKLQDSIVKHGGFLHRV
ncbi:MAG: FAD-dependent oxidoreductase [Clostridia bacterium]|nr:FAD-dependent oxidoreductase [Clostridia bacterium]